ncbi:MAG: TerB family tellurite resistance protein [SAR324 cluster bacterium]|nr:TerB family tellurite resistance protein [SAR324 cluster bacterium]
MHDSAEENLFNILYLARCLASVDGEYHPDEQKAFKNLVEVLGVDVERLKHFFQQNTPIPVALKKLQTREEKLLLVDILLVMASVDNEFTEKEKLFFSKVTDQIGVDLQDHPFFHEGEMVEVQEISNNFQVFIGNIKSKAEALFSN